MPNNRQHSHSGNSLATVLTQWSLHQWEFKSAVVTHLEPGFPISRRHSIFIPPSQNIIPKQEPSINRRRFGLNILALFACHLLNNSENLDKKVQSASKISGRTYCSHKVLQKTEIVDCQSPRCALSRAHPSEEHANIPGICKCRRYLSGPTVTSVGEKNSTSKCTECTNPPVYVNSGQPKRMRKLPCSKPVGKNSKFDSELKFPASWCSAADSESSDPLNFTLVNHDVQIFNAVVRLEIMVYCPLAVSLVSNSDLNLLKIQVRLVAVRPGASGSGGGTNFMIKATSRLLLRRLKAPPLPDLPNPCSHPTPVGLAYRLSQMAHPYSAPYPSPLSRSPTISGRSTSARPHNSSSNEAPSSHPESAGYYEGSGTLDSEGLNSPTLSNASIQSIVSPNVLSSGGYGNGPGFMGPNGTGATNSATFHQRLLDNLLQTGFVEEQLGWMVRSTLDLVGQLIVLNHQRSALHSAYEHVSCNFDLRPIHTIVNAMLSQAFSMRNMTSHVHRDNSGWTPHCQAAPFPPPPTSDPRHYLSHNQLRQLGSCFCLDPSSFHPVVQEMWETGNPRPNLARILAA
ncbi:hypothetical protein DFP72DRAFT_840301 [Ephemerocybe angulata]|uniref:Uncharacterized protein n=1 Tax=Ephemerocybe angulata TaxID=980116 RepID=A0A8H6MFK5_9AGAR|nr:hypothetical protein DFP72DRAFT_840301 [Tulosesus angulatus]